MVDWYAAVTPQEQARLLAAWPGAPVRNSELVGMLLDVAKEQVLAFAPAEPVTPDEEIGYGSEPYGNPDDVPSRYVYAQLAQAKTLWSAGMADENGNIGTEGYSFVPRPLDKTIRGIIRPTSGVADVF